jgi:hypothetical protein
VSQRLAAALPKHKTRPVYAPIRIAKPIDRLVGGPPPVADDKRTIMREVALTYQRETRASQAEGTRPPKQHHRTHEASLWNSILTHRLIGSSDRPS